jgi:hypothetical protein
MQYKFLLALLPFACSSSFSQGLTQSASGKSTILFKGTSAGIDLGSAQLNFGVNNLYRPVVSNAAKNNYTVFGANLSVANGDGIGSLFSGGDIVPSGKLNGFLGYSWSNTVLPDYVAQMKKIGQLQQTKELEYYTQFQKEALQDIAQALQQAVAKKLITTDESVIYFAAWKKDIQANAPFLFLKAFSNENINSSFKSERDSLKGKFIKILADQEKDKEGFDSMLNDLYKFKNKTNTYWKITAFGFGGIEAASFNHFSKVDSANLAASFTKENYRGGNIGVGINWQLPLFKIGLTYAYRSRDNFSLLDKTSYTLQQQVSLNGQTLTQENKLSGYSGAYGQVEVNELNADIILNIALDSIMKNNLLLNPYIRSTLFSRNKALLPNTTDIGVGFYFFQKVSKFLGGLYVEFPDIDNNIAKLNPIGQQDLRSGWKRLSFGIVTKISLTSIIANQ